MAIRKRMSTMPVSMVAFCSGCIPAALRRRCLPGAVEPHADVARAGERVAGGWWEHPAAVEQWPPSRRPSRKAEEEAKGKESKVKRQEQATAGEESCPCGDEPPVREEVGHEEAGLLGRGRCRWCWCDWCARRLRGQSRLGRASGSLSIAKPTNFITLDNTAAISASGGTQVGACDGYYIVGHELGRPGD